MVTDAFVDFVCGIMRAMLGLLPTWSPPAVDGSFGATAGGLVGVLSGYFPITVLVVCIGVVFAVKLAVSLWVVVVAIYDRVPFKMT